MTQRPLRICLIMHSAYSDNLGVGALTVSEIEVLRDVARDTGRQIEITILDRKGWREPYASGPDIRIIRLDRALMQRPWRLLGIMRRSDMVIDIGAGDSFADIYGAARLRRMFWLKYLTHLSGTPLIMAPQTVGPFSKGWSKLLARLSMRLCRVVASRDRMSTEAARALGRADVIEASDLALRLPYERPAPRSDTGPVKVGINVSGLLMGGGYTGKNEFGLSMDYPALMRELIASFQSHPEGCEVHLVGHVIMQQRAGRKSEDDYSACKALAEEFPGTVLAPAFSTPSEAKSYIAGLDFFMGARMHASIAAFSSGVAVVPMAYSRKFEGLFGSLGYNRTVDCTAESAEAIREKIIAAFQEREMLRAETQAALERGLAKIKLYEAALQDVIAGLKP